MGGTYKAFDTILQWHVVLKVIATSLGSDKAEERFSSRSSIGGAIAIPPRAFILGSAIKVISVPWSLLTGKTVEERVKCEGPINCVMAFEIAEQVACALIAAETHHLVHRNKAIQSHAGARERRDSPLMAFRTPRKSFPPNED
jgi:hypothetical protein